jgi:hypothetical protein
MTLQTESGKRFAASMIFVTRVSAILRRRAWQDSIYRSEEWRTANCARKSGGTPAA